VIFEGVDITQAGHDLDLHRRKMGMVFQLFNLFPHMTVLDNITLSPRKLRGISRPEAEEAAWKLLRRVGLEEKASAYPGQLSGGQKQRIAIVRALAMQPDVMLFDEPPAPWTPKWSEKCWRS
jgi:polar amino acid transport system ATP-binding protein